jgi:hypothetical protein
MTPAAFKRSIRDQQVWCSSCMVAFSGADPIGVLIGAKRASATLVQKIAVHPDHRRQGHARHLLASLSSKLAILGPPRIVAEVAETLAPAGALFAASGFVEEAVLTDYVLPFDSRSRGALAQGGPFDARSRATFAQGGALSQDLARVVIPITVDDLAANGLLEGAASRICWERSVETLRARKDEIDGLAVASDEQIEAYLLYVKPGAMVSLRAFTEDAGAHLEYLLAQLRAHGMTQLTFSKVHETDMPHEILEKLGFRPANRHRLYAAKAKAE